MHKSKTASKVALVKITEGHDEAFQRALNLIGCDELTVERKKDVVIKIGIYDPKNLNYPTIEVTRAAVEAFSSAPHVYLAESDNIVDAALERLQIWKEVYTDRVLPFNLSKDSETIRVKIAGEKLDLSHKLFTPNILVSLHAYRARRGLGQPYYGTILKNMFGVIPDIEKNRFHPKLGEALVDIIKTVGGIDLAVIDATYAYYGKFQSGKQYERVKTDLLIVGTDGLSVDAVGATLAGNNPVDSPTLSKAARLGLGHIDIKNIVILGESLESVKLNLPEP